MIIPRRYDAGRAIRRSGTISFGGRKVLELSVHDERDISGVLEKLRIDDIDDPCDIEEK